MVFQVRISGILALALLLAVAIPSVAKNDGHGKQHQKSEHSSHGKQSSKSYKRVPPGHVKHQLRHDEWLHHRAHHWEREHRSWHARGGYRGHRIPDSHFRLHFGPAHSFRVHTLPVMVVEGHPRFKHGGFWFTMVDPWPEHWAPAWYEADDVYVDYVNDGYYMYNRAHPGVAIAVNVSF